MFHATFASGNRRIEATFEGCKEVNVTFQNTMVIEKYTDHQVYQGEYEVTPTIDKQILPTKDKVMVNDLVIEEIPHYTVSNNKGDTFVIGEKDIIL